MTYILRATETGAIVINGNPYQRGTLRVFPYKQAGVEYAELLIEDAFGNVIVPAAPFGDFETDGDAFASGPDLKDFVEANFFKIATAGAGSGGGFSALSGTELNGGNKFITLTANTALTIKPGVNNSFRIYVVQDGTGNRTFSIAGQALTISTAAGSDTLIEADVVNGNYVFSVNTSPVAVAIPVPDTTAPTIVSVEAIDANHIRIVFSEAVSGSDSGFAFTANAAGLTITADAGDGTNTKTYTITETMADSDVLAYAYVKTSGDTEDTSGNKLESASGSVVNSVPAPSTGYRTLSNAGLGVAALDATKWDATSHTESTGAGITGVSNGVMTISGGNGQLSSFNVINTDYPKTAYHNLKQTGDLIIGSVNPSNTNDLLGPSLTVIGWTQAGRYSFFVQTSGWTGDGGNFGYIGVVGLGMNGYKYSSAGFSGLSIGQVIKAELVFLNGIWTFTANRYDSLNNFIDSLNFTVDSSPYTGGDRFSYFGCRAAFGHLGGTHSYANLVLATGAVQNPDLVVFTDSHAWSFPSANANAGLAQYIAANPTKQIEVVGGGGYTLGSLSNVDSDIRAEGYSLNPKNILVQMGSNDAFNNASAATISTEMTTLKNDARSNLPGLLTVFFRNLLPVTAAASSGTISNNIPVINSGLQTTVTGFGAGHVYYDVFSFLKDSSSNDFNPTYTTEGVHTNDAGQSILGTQMITNVVI